MKMNRPDIQEENVHLKAIYMCGHAKIIAAWRAGWNISIILFLIQNTDYTFSV